MIRIDRDIPGRIRVTFPYDPQIVSKTKTVTSRKWHSEEKYWGFQHSPQVLNELISALDGEKLDIDSSLEALLSQASTYILAKHTSSTKEPLHNNPVLDRVRKMIRLKPSSTQNQAFNALLFLYREVLKKDLDESINAIRAKKPHHLPTVMTKDEVMRVIAATSPTIS